MASSKKNKSEREREKLIQDRLQILLTRMLQDDDNKYCVDCDAKGPRWASWNLGIFMCIRCAGIHRNLGVHISRVKSVNLDSWTPLQVASMQIMGNSRARAIYEAQVSEEFRRPQVDSLLEVFIRAKYERKKYIAREWVPTKAPEYPAGWNELIEAEKQKKDLRSVMLPQSTSPTKSPAATTPRPTPSNGVQNKESSKETSSSNPINNLSTELFAISVSATQEPRSVSKSNFSSDLLGLGALGEVNVPGNDLLGLSGVPSDHSTNLFNNYNNNNGTPKVTSSQEKNETTLFSLDLASDGNNSQSNPVKLSKDSILALFNKPSGSLFQPPQTNFAQEPSALHQKHFSMNSFGVPPPAQAKVSGFQDLNVFMGKGTPPSTSLSGPTIDQTLGPLHSASSLTESNNFAFF